MKKFKMFGTGNTHFTTIVKSNVDIATEKGVAIQIEKVEKRRASTGVGLMLGISLAMLCSVSTSAAESETTPPPAEQTRVLIYCADLMTHEEREAYRTSMRAAGTPQQRAALRQAHQQAMQLRAQERGLDVMECEPLRLRKQQHGGQP